MAKGTNGTGTVYKPKHPSKNFPFRAEVWITDLSKPSGKRRISKNFKKKSQAEAWREETVRKYGNHSESSAFDPEITLVQWLIYWLKTFCLNIKDSTKTGYECYINQHIGKHPIGSIKLKNLNVCDLQSYIGYLATDGNLKGGGISPKTIRSTLLMVRKSLKAAVGAGLLDKNPADFIILPKLEQKPVEYLSLKQVKSLISISRNERWGIFFPLAFMTGCRIGELGALRRNSLKYTDGIWYLSIEGSLYRVKNFSEETDKKTILRVGSTKNSKSRQIPIPIELVNLLHEHFKKQDEESYGCYITDPFIFCNKLGNFVDPSTLRNWSKDIAANAGVNNFHPHLLRRSYATLAATNMDIKNLSAILGHSSCNVSTQYYIASDINTKNIAMTKMKPFYDELLG